ncbi:MAG: DUF456 domain-containing protein [Tannerella sp.]|jgi:uncharacterized protein YqgC (DUF456 family)|nr:DUF456 domain-containing protein [Tannerella sp.]
MLDILLIVLGAICLLLGFVGCLLPVMPGPPLAYAGLLSLHFTDKVQFSGWNLFWWLILVIITLIADYLLPVLGVKRFNGTKWGNIGCIVGLIAGAILFPPLGIIVGPFLGAFLGEAFIAKKNTSDALKAGCGAFLGFLLGTVMKLVVCSLFAFYFIKGIFDID